MSQKFKAGDAVTWNSGPGKARGTVEEYVTETRTVEGQMVDASSSDPRYLVKNSHTGKVTGHKPENLTKVSHKEVQNASKSSASSSNESEPFHPGDQVKWNTAQGQTTGNVIKKLTSPMQIKNYTVQASEENPYYLVESNKTGEQAAHKPDALDRVS